MGGRFTNWIAAAVTAAAIALVSFPAAVLSFPTHYPDKRCATNAPAQTVLAFNSTSIFVGPRPWGLAYLNEYIAFAAVNFSVVVLDTTEFTPKILTRIPFPEARVMGNTDIESDGYGYREVSLTHDKKNLYVATGYGAIIIDTVKAIQGRNDSIAGVLKHANGYVGQSAVELSITPDDKYVFISQEFGSNASYNRGAIEVFNVNRGDDGTVTNIWKGFLALGFATVGQQFSSDYTKLFVTSEMNTTKASINATAGVISVLDVKKLKTLPGTALIRNYYSGCRPVRCHMSADGERLWVTERDINELAVFDTTRLADGETTDVLLNTTTVGTSPIGIAGLGKYIFTADSNRFDYPNATSGVTVVDSTTSLQLGQIPTGSFPRSLAVSPGGTRLLISEFDGGTIRVVDVTSLNT